MNVTVTTRNGPKQGSNQKNNTQINRQVAQQKARNQLPRPGPQRPPGQGLSRSAIRRRNRAAQAVGTLGPISGPRARPNSRRNAYLDALTDPSGAGKGVRIPDMECQESGTYQIYRDLTMVTGATGDAYALCWYPRCVDDCVIAANNATAGANLVWTAATDMPAVTSLNTIYDMSRLVSAEMIVEFIGNTSTNQGIVIGGCVPQSTTAFTGGVTLSSFFDVPHFQYFPLRDGIRILYKPTDNADFEYYPTIDTPNQISASVGSYPPALVCCIQGAAQNTSLMKVRLVANFEGLPKTSSFDFVQTAPSLSNSSWMDSAMNAMSGLKTAWPLITAAAPVVGSAYANYMGNRQLGQFRARPIV